MGSRAGFRFGWQDGVAIGLAAGATWIGWGFLGSGALLVPLTLGHFFLFCNVFRLRRSYELYWTVVFLLNVGVWLFRRGARSVGFREEVILAFALASVLGGVVGARALWIFEHTAEIGTVGDLFLASESGLSGFGALAGGVVGALLYG